ncbi:hypothetical protein BROUX41_004548 [Berkeleyomyces rouxiae]|uniref:uncharacterized protein n=1 Tax=Berkeleyomyces rouxiae TaxID=2035830 RepID=UPI003B7CE4FA
MATKVISQEGSDGKAELDIINFDASDNASISYTEKHDMIENEIDWEDHKESAVESNCGFSTETTVPHATNDPLLTPDSKSNAVVDETEGAQDLASASAANHASEGAFEHDISYELEIEADDVAVSTAPIGVEENEIDYEDNTDLEAHSSSEAKPANLESTADPGQDESFNGEAPDGVLIDQGFTGADDTEDASMIVHGDLTIVEGKPTEDGENEQSGVSLHDHVEDKQDNSHSHADKTLEAEEHESADASPVDQEDQDGFPTSSLVPDITVRYNGEEYPLFHGQNNIDTQMGFFHDVGVLDAPIDDVLSSFRNELTDDLEENEELVLQIDDLGLQYSETTNADVLGSITLRQLYNLLLKLSQNQNPSSVPTMYTYLNTRLNTTRRLAYLLQEAYSGSSLESVAHRFPQETASEPSIEDADEDMEDVEEDDDQSDEIEEEDEDEQENEDYEEQNGAVQGEYDEQSAEGDEEEEENQDEEEDEIPADDLETITQQSTSEQQQPLNEEYEAHDELNEGNRDEYLDFASGVIDNAQDEATLVQSEAGENELYLDDHEEGGVSVDNAEFLMDGSNVNAPGLELDTTLEVSLDSDVGASFDATNFSAADVDVGADLDTFFDINGDVVTNEFSTADGTHPSGPSSSTEHGDEITYDEDDDDNAGVALDVGDDSILSQSHEINDQGKRLRPEEEDFLETDENDAKRIRS